MQLISFLTYSLIVLGLTIRDLLVFRHSSPHNVFLYLDLSFMCCTVYFAAMRCLGTAEQWFYSWKYWGFVAVLIPVMFVFYPFPITSL
jgi:hypothetical protein